MSQDYNINLIKLGVAVAQKLPTAIIDKLKLLNHRDGLFQINTNTYKKTDISYTFYFTDNKNYNNVRLYISIENYSLQFGFHLGFENNLVQTKFYKNLDKWYDYLYYLLHHCCLGKTIHSFTGVLDIDGKIFLDKFTVDDDFEKTNICRYFLNNKTNYSDSVFIFLDSCSYAILEQSFDELSKNITQTFIDLFPFIILAISDDPVPEIYKFTGFIDYKYITEKITELTYLPESDIQRYINTLDRKKHIIFQGSPGTGKTFLAKQLAHYLTLCNDGFYEIIQFHPAYTYEDFMQGIRPITREDGQLEYKMIKGRFLEFCEKAEKCKTDCILIIDEINRANLSQVFGELMYLLEYRDETIKLAGSDKPFKIPKNVRIIGTMNTADRSIALVDYALRRRFALITLHPNHDILKKYHQDHNTNFPVDELIDILKQINQTINDPHYYLGISYFLTPTLKTEIEDIWCMEIEPYLEEYFFNKPEEVDQFRWNEIKKKIPL